MEVAGVRTGAIHLDRGEALLLTIPRTIKYIRWLVPADPSIDPHPIAHFASEKLPDRNAQHLAFDIPERDIKARQRRLDTESEGLS